MPPPPLERPREPIFVPPPASPPPSPAEAEAQAREALVEAVVSRHRQDEVLAYDGHIALQRDRVADLRAALEPFADLDERLISSQLDKLKAGLSDELADDL